MDGGKGVPLFYCKWKEAILVGIRPTVYPLKLFLCYSCMTVLVESISVTGTHRNSISLMRWKSLIKLHLINEIKEAQKHAQIH